MFVLRDFQSLNKMQIRQQFRHHQRVMYQAGTGSGKTVVASSIIADAIAKGSPTWFLAHRRELIKQARESLMEMELRPGVIMSGWKYDPSKALQCASIDMRQGDILVLIQLHIAFQL